jgi:hypothetical protein
MAWAGWPLERFLYLFLAAAFLLVWLQVTLLHWRGGFRSKFMYGPVLFTPLLVVAGLAMGMTRQPAVSACFLVIYAVGVLEGVAGTALHLRGCAMMVGGVNLRNLMAGPPLFLPIIYLAVAALGLLIYYWPKTLLALAMGRLQ